MRRLGWKMAIAATALFLTPQLGRAQETAPVDPMAGTWKVKLTPTEGSEREGAKGFSDAMVFEGNQLLTECFALYGFAPGDYWIWVDPNGAENYAVSSLQSGSKGDLYWGGSVTQGTITGFLVWTRTDGTVWCYNYTGTRLPSK